jgi:hypothetical protein
MKKQFNIFENSRENEEKLAAIENKDRVLLMSHCMRSSENCTARITKEGVQCRDDCPDRCQVGRLRLAAENMGYKGICIAPGGSIAIKFVKETKPGGIVAIACMKELEEGVCAIKEFVESEKNHAGPIVIATVPLLKDGCVDTEVDEEDAKRVIEI